MTITPIFEIDNVKIYLNFDYTIDALENFEKEFKKNSIIYILTSWYKGDKAIKIVNKYINYNFIILANSIEEKEFYETKVNSDVLFCNHNAFLNENNYNINRTKILYDLVIDSCFCDYKNTSVASNILNTIHIGYIKTVRNQIILPNFGIIANNYLHENENYKRLTKKEINDIYNSCYIGGLFSPVEGACFASSQYLLSGLPVVSIKSKGGRDIWYSSNNSIICENNKEDCYKCVMIAKEKVLNNEFDPFKIRSDTIKLMNKFRCIFKESIILNLKNIYNIEMTNLDLNLSIY